MGGGEASSTYMPLLENRLCWRVRQEIPVPSVPASAGVPAVGGMLACGIPSCEALVGGYSNELCRN